VRIGWLRSVFNINHAFAVQSFLDEIAAAAGRDPREVLLEILGPARTLTLEEAGVKTIPNYGATLDQHPVDVGRLRNVIERVTERAGWDSLRKSGRAVGLAAHRSFLTYTAAVAAVSRGPRGGIQVDEVWITADAGKVINPDRVHAQLEGAVIFGISLALHGAITMRGGAVEQTNYRDYPVARIEPGVPPIPPAIANAVFALTGTRVRELPLRGPSQTAQGGRR
jgi:isoquinoline 1-oxidoreductase beta subunit